VDLARAFAKPFEDLLPADDPEPKHVKGEQLSFNTNNRGRFHVTVLAGDRGLCGAFNTSTFRLAGKLIDNALTRDTQVTIVAIGRKVEKPLHKKFGPNMTRAFTETSKLKKPTFTQAMMIGETLASIDFDFGYFIYNRPRTMATYEQMRVPQKSKRASIELIKKNMKWLTAGGVTDETLSNLLDFRSAAVLWQAQIDSLSAELAARAASMNGAATNTKEMVRELTLLMNRARQDKITKDLTELSAGVAAIMGQPK